MAKFQFITTRDRGVYDGNTQYRMFDEVADSRGNHVVLIVPGACGVDCGNRNAWKPISEISDPIMPYQKDATDAELTALLDGLKAAGLMAAEAPVLTVSSLSADLATETAADAVEVACVIVSSDGRAVAYQWYSSETDSNEGGAAVSGADESAFTLPVYDTAGTYYYYCVGSLEGVTIASDAIIVTVAEATP